MSHVYTFNNFHKKKEHVDYIKNSEATKFLVYHG